MYMYKNILIAVDGSHEAEWAFNKAVAVAKRNNAKLIIVNVIDSRTYTSFEVYDSHFTEKSKSFAEKLLDGYRQVAQHEGIQNVETRLEFGSPKSVLPKLASDENSDVDLVMCGTSGLNAVERFIVGSVSEAIVRHSACDVLVVRTEQIPENFEPKVATDELLKDFSI
ncbi:universal stress protein [Staphylococcus pseudintermedius]|uniref:universal stress protein n=1 Tax=Staphylococcus pseudintermedius TaxID=283734 RepID=UPI001A066E6C|nr:universal stress protein [Staphylococcus pseudintermedius]EGQ2823206.1 universal stress protein [Staphylococcus pseudintermedius]EIA5788445.1 universal stress protein [Staphylococcus pseudintermedius]EJD8467720.1 universal stress protein [Staphylococcus pseudintermedius]EJD8480881.1 universal stress protein [Staphylococcus pseudintermedius]MBU7227342.1 universal stress protein [Staphylococcus pseudintermedius]